jgi:ABC-type branched-subunit amino acid transport system ATPase component
MDSLLLKVENLHKAFDGVRALNGVSLEVKCREIVGLIGPNGAGKTTLFNVLTGFLAADEGSATFRGQNILGKPPHIVALAGMARTFQRLRLIGHLTVLENVLLWRCGQPGERLANVFFRWRTSAKKEAENRELAQCLLADVGLSDKADDLADSLSYGQQKLLSLACCLAGSAELLLLDEPVAGIAPEMIERVLSIVESLPNRGRSVMLIEHNLDAVARVCNRVVFMDSGAKLCEGTPQDVRNDPRVIEAYID